MIKFFQPHSSVRYTDAALLILRVFLPLLLIPHGYDKLTNFLNGATDFPDPIFLGPRLSFILTIVAEFICPILLILGLGSRIALMILVIHFFVVSFILHAPDPLSDKEHALMYLIPFVALLLTGPGKLSLDTLFFSTRNKT